MILILLTKINVLHFKRLFILYVGFEISIKVWAREFCHVIYLLALYLIIIKYSGKDETYKSY